MGSIVENWVTSLEDMIEGLGTMTLESKSIGELDRSHRLVSMSIRLSERVVGNGRTRALGRCCGGGGRNSLWHSLHFVRPQMGLSGSGWVPNSDPFACKLT